MKCIFLELYEVGGRKYLIKRKAQAEGKNLNASNIRRNAIQTEFQDENARTRSRDINADLLPRGYFKDKTLSRQLTKVGTNMYLKVENVSGEVQCKSLRQLRRGTFQ